MCVCVCVCVCVDGVCILAARVKRSATNSDDQLSDSPMTSTPRQKKPRVFFTEQQKTALRDALQRDSYPNQTSFEQLASQLGVGTKTVVNWFHNHRMRAKQQQVRRKLYAVRKKIATPYRPDGGETICLRRWPFRSFPTIRPHRKPRQMIRYGTPYDAVYLRALKKLTRWPA